MNKRILFITFFGLFIILNLVPTYMWLWGITFIDLERPEFSTIEVDTREILDSILWYTMLIGIWLPITIITISRKWQLKTLIVPTLISLSLFVVMIKSQDVYPDESSEYTERGYHYRIEKWNEKSGTKIQRWKSQDSLKNYASHRHIQWELINDEIKN
tara:strand:- start:228 stop:701 length:474 start_codon:yes stop_codon:yes gene_type:complete